MVRVIIVFLFNNITHYISNFYLPIIAFFLGVIFNFSFIQFWSLYAIEIYNTFDVISDPICFQIFLTLNIEF